MLACSFNKEEVMAETEVERKEREEREAKERNPNAATPATPAKPNPDGGPATPATPASPSRMATMAGPKEGPRSLDKAADLNPNRQRHDRERPTMGERMDRERARGAEVAAANAAKFEEAERLRREGDEGERDAEEGAKTELQQKFEDSAAAVDDKMANLPPPGPGLAKPDPDSVRKTMDPNNPLVNPRASDEEKLKRQPLPPGAFTPAPVLPQDTVQTQEASKPPTPEHAEAGEQNRGAAETPPKDYGEPSKPSQG
jgi:hypothetical protein